MVPAHSWAGDRQGKCQNSVWREYPIWQRNLRPTTRHIVVVDKENNRALLIDIGVPGDVRVNETEQEKVEKYQDLTTEIKRLWKVENTVMHIVTVALRTISRGLEENLRTLGITIKVELIQKVALLGTARILRKVYTSMDRKQWRRKGGTLRFPGYKTVWEPQWYKYLHCHHMLWQKGNNAFISDLM